MKWLKFSLLTAVFGVCWGQQLVVDYETNFEIWETAGPFGLPVEDYEFKYQSISGLNPANEELVDVEVHTGAVVNVTYANSSVFAAQGDPAPDDFVKRSIDDVFELIAAGLEIPDVRDGMQVLYDDTFGYPSFTKFKYSNGSILEIFISDFVDRTTTECDIGAFEEGQALWNSFGPVTNYNFQYRVNKFAPVEDTQLMDIKVRDKEVVEVTYAETTVYADAGDPAPMNYTARSIEDVFAGIALSIANQGSTHECHATYDSTFGYPTFFYVDPDEEVIDDEETTYISNFQEANEGLSVDGEQPQPLENGDVQIGTVLTEVLGDSVEVTINLTGYAEDCCLKETHICNYPTERMFNISACEKVTHYPMEMSRMHDFICDEVGDTFQLDGHANILCDEPIEGADGSYDGEGWCYGAMYWINFLCV